MVIPEKPKLHWYIKIALIIQDYLEHRDIQHTVSLSYVPALVCFVV
jgi:hypothetical protein